MSSSDQWEGCNRLFGLSVYLTHAGSFLLTPCRGIDSLYRKNEGGESKFSPPVYLYLPVVSSVSDFYIKKAWFEVDR